MLLVSTIFIERSVIVRKIGWEKGKRKRRRKPTSRICVSYNVLLYLRYTVCAKRIVNGTRSNRAHQHADVDANYSGSIQRGMLITLSITGHLRRGNIRRYLFSPAALFDRRVNRVPKILVLLHFVLPTFPP